MTYPAWFWYQQGIIQKKSASSSQTLPCLLIFFFQILFWSFTPIFFNILMFFHSNIKQIKFCLFWTIFHGVIWHVTVSEIFKKIIKMIIFCICKNLLNNKKASFFNWREYQLKKKTKIIVLNDFKKFSGRKPSKLAFKTKWYQSYCFHDNFQNVSLKNILKKLHFEPKSPSTTGKVRCYYNSWVTGICMAYKL